MTGLGAPPTLASRPQIHHAHRLSPGEHHAVAVLDRPRLALDLVIEGGQSSSMYPRSSFDLPDLRASLGLGGRQGQAREDRPGCRRCNPAPGVRWCPSKGWSCSGPSASSSGAATAVICRDARHRGLPPAESGTPSSPSPSTPLPFARGNFYRPCSWSRARPCPVRVRPSALPLLGASRQIRLFPRPRTFFYRPAPRHICRSGRRAGKEKQDAALDLVRSLGSHCPPGQRPEPRGPASVRA